MRAHGKGSEAAKKRGGVRKKGGARSTGTPLYTLLTKYNYIIILYYYTSIISRYNKPFEVGPGGADVAPGARVVVLKPKLIFRFIPDIR